MWLRILLVIMLIDFFIPDPLPYIDEIILFFWVFLLSIKERSLLCTIVVLGAGILEFIFKIP
jgi:hypothetical protein